MTRNVEIAATSPYVAGHFPGRPVLPGIVQIAMALDLLQPARLRTLALARFRRLIVPPARVELAVKEIAPERVRVAVTCDGARAATIELALGEPVPAADWGLAVAARRLVAPPAIETMIPHRAPMLFVDGVVGEAEDGMTCSAHVPSESALVTQGTAPAIVVLEAAAQTAAVWEALRSARSGEGRAAVGYLVSAHDVELHETRVPALAPLTATARRIAHAGPLSHYRIEVACETQPVLRGTIGAYLEERALVGHTDRKQNH